MVRHLYVAFPTFEIRIHSIIFSTKVKTFCNSLGFISKLNLKTKKMRVSPSGLALFFPLVSIATSHPLSPMDKITHGSNLVNQKKTTPLYSLKIPSLPSVFYLSHLPLPAPNFFLFSDTHTIWGEGETPLPGRQRNRDQYNATLPDQGTKTLPYPGESNKRRIICSRKRGISC